MRGGRTLSALLLALVAAGAPGARADDARPPSLLLSYRLAARLHVPVQELSGLAPLPGGTKETRPFLAISDEGRVAKEGEVIEGSLYRLEVHVDEAAMPTIGSSTPISLAAEGLPAGFAPDLEAAARLDGADGCYLLGGERNPDDPHAKGGNALWVVRYPAGDERTARPLAHFLLPEQPDDEVNDRIEAVAARPDVARRPVQGQGAGEGGAAGGQGWQVFAFKERTADPDRVPVYWSLTLRRGDDGWHLGGSASDGEIGAPRPLVRDRRRVGVFADAVFAPDGTVWVLDRWRREIHVAKVVGRSGAAARLEPAGGLDFLDVVKDVPQDGRGVLPFEPSPPGGGPRGYGRHEAMTFDAQGWLWLGADLGSGRKSPLAALAPR